MSILAIKKGLEILVSGTNVDELRRLIVMTIVSSYLSPASTNEEPTKDDSLSALLSRLPTKTLGDVASISKGKTGIKDAQPGRFPLVVTAEARSTSDHFDFEGPGVMIPMVSSTGHGDASLKRVHFQDGQYAVGSILAVVQPNDSSVLSARYLHAYLSAFKDELLVSRMVGTANVSLTVAKISDVPVPLLPIQGQQKIDELMALCDRLEAEQADAEAAHAKLVETLLGTLTQSTNATDLAANWLRLAEHFDPLFTTESSLDALKQTILQLAVMGKLVPQDPNDEPASELLKRIAQERARLVALGQLRKASMVGHSSCDRYNSLPAGWLCTDIGSVAFVVTDGTHKTPKYCSSGVKFVSAKDIRGGRLSFADCKFISYEEHADLARRCNPEFGDILVSKSGSIGTVVRVDVQEEFSLFESLALIKFSGQQINGDYLVLAIRNACNTLQEGDVKGVAVKHLHLNVIRSLNLALPPLSEQHRIVAKVDELMALCDRLKADLVESHTRQARLSATLIESALQAA